MTFINVASLALVALVGLPHGATADLPKVDFNRMGKVAIAGSFAGLDLYSPNSTNSFDPTTSTLLTRASNGTLTSLGSTNSGGSIIGACVLNGKLYFAGSFSSVAGTSAANVATYDPQSRSFAALGQGLDGPVNAIYCDSSSGKIWAGGKFRAPVAADATKYGGSVATYDTKANSWSPTPFFGLSGASAQVHSIIPSSSGASLYFGGSFITNFGGNTTTINSTNNPNIPYSPGATPYSSSLVPIPLAKAEISANPTTSLSGFDSITNILCPGGDDGAGNSWFAADNYSPLIVVRTNKFATASGVRIGNTFIDGRGTKTFNIISIPDNNLLTLTYIDPVTKANSTCSNSCPLLSDKSILYQDFIFESPQTLTGFQLIVTEWNGLSAGLHILQLLSNGAFASAINSDNTNSCYAPQASSVKQTGDWKSQQVTTGIAGTVQDVLVATVPVGTSPGSAPSLTWYPYVSASGIYEVYIRIPGCDDLQDCASRTSVKVTVFPGGDMQPWVTPVSERVHDDTLSLVYRGFVVPSSPEFISTVSLTLADKPEGQGSGGKYDIVADRVQFQLISVNDTISSNGTSGPGSPLNSTQTSSTGYGFFEWPLESSATSVNATGVIANSSETSFDKVATKFSVALGSGASGAVVRAIAASGDNLAFVAGSFSVSNGPVNIAAFRSDAISTLSGSGLNGVVNALALANGTLWVGGAFTDTSSGGTSGLKGVAKYDVATDKWSTLGGGVNGVVLSLSVSNGQVSVAGNFTEVYSTTDDLGSPVGGFAEWNIAAGSWASSTGLFVGSASLTVPTTSANDPMYIAGNIAASSSFGASGWAMIQTGKNGQISITSPGSRLQDVPATIGSPNSTSTRRRGSRRNDGGIVSWLMPRIHAAVFPRQSSVLATLPPPPPSPAPAVLTGAFWTNTTSSHEIIILGGNFSFTTNSSSTRSEGVALYDETTGSTSALKGDQIDGVVTALLVSSSTLFVGGAFSHSGAEGLAMYDLLQEIWLTDAQGLKADSGSVVVRSLTAIPSQNNLFLVAGSFSGAGSLPCEGLCTWDISRKQWGALGNGIKGDVATVAYAKDDSDLLVIGGSLELQDGTPANVARYSFSNSTWAAIGSSNDIPGPVTALSINDEDIDNIFVAGKSSDGTKSFMLHWDGSKWNSLGDALQGSASVSQLQMVPLSEDHDANSIIQKDRMLLVSGSLNGGSFGNASTALYDGKTFYPYITSTSQSGGPGLISGLFHSFTSFSFNHRHFLATGIVILISIAIAAGIVFFLLLIGVLWTLLARENPITNDPHADETENDDDHSLHRPSSLLAHINAATRTTIIGGATVGATVDSHGSDEYNTTQDHDHDGSGWRRSETPAVVGAGGAGDYDEGEEETGRPAHARYSFDAGNEGELALQTGAELLVLDDRDPAWWYVRNQHTGQEGVVPAAYLY